MACNQDEDPLTQLKIENALLKYQKSVLENKQIRTKAKLNALKNQFNPCASTNDSSNRNSSENQASNNQEAKTGETIQNHETSPKTTVNENENDGDGDNSPQKCHDQDQSQDQQQHREQEREECPNPSKKPRLENEGAEENVPSSSSSAPTDTPTYLTLKEEGNNYFNLRNYGQALEKYNEAIALATSEEAPAPENVVSILHQNRAAVYEKFQKWAMVISECSASLELNPRYIKPITRRAKAYKETGRLEEALEDAAANCFLESLKQKSENESNQIYKDLLRQIVTKEADQLIKTRKPKRPSSHSIATFFRSFYSDPCSVIWTKGLDREQPNKRPDFKGYRLAITKLYLHDTSNLIEFCTNEINFPGSKYVPDALLLRGTMRFLWGYRAETLEDFNTVISHENASKKLKSAAWVKKGLYYSYFPPDQANEWREHPEFCFSNAELLTPRNPDIYYQRGQFLARQGHVDLADLQLQRVIQLAPDFSQAIAASLSYQCSIARNKGDVSKIDKIMDECRNYLSHFPNCPHPYTLLGEMLQAKGDFVEAIKQFDQVIQKEPKNVRAIGNKILLQNNLTKTPEKALEELRNLCKTYDKDDYLYTVIGDQLMQLESFSEAADFYTKAIPWANSCNTLYNVCSRRKEAQVHAKVQAKFSEPVEAQHS